MPLLQFKKYKRQYIKFVFVFLSYNLFTIIPINTNTTALLLSIAINL